MALRFPAARQLWLGSYWIACSCAFWAVLGEESVHNFFRASDDYWSGWIWLFLLSFPWALGFELLGYVVAAFMPGSFGFVLGDESGRDWWHLSTAAVSVAINSFLIYSGTRESRNAV